MRQAPRCGAHGGAWQGAHTYIERLLQVTPGKLTHEREHDGYISRRDSDVQGQLFTHYFLTDGIRTTPEWKASVDVPDDVRIVP